MYVYFLSFWNIAMYFSTKYLNASIISLYQMSRLFYQTKYQRPLCLPTNTLYQYKCFAHTMPSKWNIKVISRKPLATDRKLNDNQSSLTIMAVIHILRKYMPLQQLSAPRPARRYVIESSYIFCMASVEVSSHLRLSSWKKITKPMRHISRRERKSTLEAIYFYVHYIVARNREMAYINLYCIEPLFSYIAKIVLYDEYQWPEKYEILHYNNATRGSCI